MHKTQFAGLTAPDPDDAALQVDGGSFANRNPDITDYFLSIGAVSHRHDAHDPLPSPTFAPSALVSPSGGSIESGTAIYLGWTASDAYGGETVLSPPTLVTTVDQAPTPTGTLAVEFVSSAGVMPTGTYDYAITVMDAGGGESVIGPATTVQREPGFASGQMLISGLTDDLLNDGDRWRLYRSDNGGPFDLIAVGTDDTFLDYGIDPVDHAAQPPLDSGRTRATSAVDITLPMASGASGNVVLQDPQAAAINLYLSLDGSFASPALVQVFPLASAGMTYRITDTIADIGAPPDVATSIRGANRIDPDTELLDWHWKRPVTASGDLPTGSATASGDVRVVLADGQPYRFIDGAWAQWAMGGGGGGSGVSRLPIDTVGGSDANMPIWTKNGVDVLWLRGHESGSDVTVMSQDFAGASGTIGDGYALDGSGHAIPEAGSDDTNAIHYPPMSPTWAQLYDGYVERTFTVTSANWTRIGVTLGTGRVGLFAWIDTAGNLVIATRTVDSNLEADFTTIATDALPAAPASGDTYNIQLDRTDNHLHATVHQSKAVVAEVEVDIPAPLRADFGDLVALQPGLSDRWSNPDAWTTDSASAVWHRHLRELYVEGLDDQGAVASYRLFDGVGDKYGFVSSQAVGAYSADWADDVSLAFFYQRTVEGWLKFMGKAVKSTGSAPTNGEVIATLDAEAWPVNGDFVVPVVTGDDDGEELGMVKITAAGDVVWLGGRSTAPATKHPYVVFDGVPSYPNI